MIAASAATINANQPRTVPSYAYDGIYSLLQSKGIPILGYDAAPDTFIAPNLKTSGGAIAKFRQFTGKERDSESGLDYFGASDDD